MHEREFLSWLDRAAEWAKGEFTAIHRHLERIAQMSEATQADVDALTTELTAALGRIQTKLDEVQTQNPGVDLSSLKSEVDAVNALVPTPSTDAGSGDVSATPDSGPADTGNAGTTDTGTDAAAGGSADTGSTDAGSTPSQ